MSEPWPGKSVVQPAAPPLATPIKSTAHVPEGTLVNVPTAAPTGGAGLPPVVAVNTVSKWMDPTFLAALGGAALALADPIIEVLSKPGPINWRSLILGCILALVAYSRTRSNSVTK